MAKLDDIAKNEDMVKIANAIRNVTRTNDPMTIPQMPERLLDIRVIEKALVEVNLKASNRITLGTYNTAIKHFFIAMPRGNTDAAYLNRADANAELEYNETTGELDLVIADKVNATVEIYVLDMLLASDAESAGVLIATSEGGASILPYDRNIGYQAGEVFIYQDVLGLTLVAHAPEQFNAQHNVLFATKFAVQSDEGITFADLYDVYGGLREEAEQRREADTQIRASVQEVEQSVNTEKTRAEAAEEGLAQDIVAEREARDEAVSELGESLQTAKEELQGNIDAVDGDVQAVKDLIPNQATEQNQLADKEFVNSSINSVAAYPIEKNAAGDAFETKAELSSATVFYSGGQVRVPTRNDYTIVRVDETHSGATARYYYNNGWRFQYVINGTTFTAAQLAALNSGITGAKISQIDEDIAQVAEDTAAKLTKDTSTIGSKVYARDEGVDKMISYDKEASASSLAQRESSGALKVATPTQDAHAATKGYVDTAIASKAPQIDITYSELRALRDGAQLIPGMRYRITDYVTKIWQKNARSLKNPFYVIVTADDERTLNENATIARPYYGTETIYVPQGFVNMPSLENPVDFVASQWLDSEDAEYEAGDGGHLDYDKLVYGGMENGIPVAYKTDMESEEYSQEVDFGDKFVWDKRVNIEGTIYDRWVKYDEGSEIPERYYLTEVITNDEFVPVEKPVKGPFTDIPLEKYQVKYTLDNDFRKWAAQDEGETRKYILVYASEESESEGLEDDMYLHVRYPEGDIDGKYAWAYVVIEAYLDKYDDTEVFEAGIDKFDIGYTDTEEIIPGETKFNYYDEVTTVQDYKEITREGDGKGVIYWMKDDRGNEAPYDFENVQYKRFVGDLPGYGVVYSPICIRINGVVYPLDAQILEDTLEWKKTFSTGHEYGGRGSQTFNVIKETNIGEDIALNDIVIMGWSAGSTFDVGCRYNSIYGPASFGMNCLWNFSLCYGESKHTFGAFSQHNRIMDGSNNEISAGSTLNTVSGSNNILRNAGWCTVNSYNSIVEGNSHKVYGQRNEVHGFSNVVYGQYNIVRGEQNFVTADSSYNSIGDGTSNNALTGNSSYNSIGGASSNNTLTGAQRNEIGTNCNYIQLTNTNTNVFKSGCHNIILNGGWANVFGQQCRDIEMEQCTRNEFAADCYSIQLGYGCTVSKFDAGCSNIHLPNESYGNHFGPWCSNITAEVALGHCEFKGNVANLTLVAAPGAGWRVFDITLHQGVKGTYENPLTIALPKTGEKAFDIYKSGSQELYVD